MAATRQTDHTVSIRMYNMGFGDAFLVTVRRGDDRWRMLVDCGVHAQGQARPLAKSVQTIVDDLTADADGGHPHLDVIVATHHHADHIAGFALDAWNAVTVDEVWVPFVEDDDDPDAKALRKQQTDAANKLQALVADRTSRLDSGAWPAALSVAHDFAVNSSGNETATNRLLGQQQLGFAAPHRVRYLPSVTPEDNVIDATVPDVRVHVLGPSRDPAQLKRMDPPKAAGWLTLQAEDDAGERVGPLFDPHFVMDDDELEQHPGLASARRQLGRLDRVDDEALLAAASVLEGAVNNTSIFFVLDVAGTHFLFPGDAQEGAWDHVLDDDEARALVQDAAFYKISHHGSHNGTPKRFVDEILHDGAHAMLPYGLVKRWQKTIPKTALLDDLVAHKHRITRADKPEAEPKKVVVHGDLWSEVTFSVPS
jgi:beta-lactamase superfamily II metal-dependent hydrolase